MSTASEYWKKPTPQSLRKISLVSNYFGSWLKVMLFKTQGEISYSDLFSGHGFYDDKTASTPLRIVQHILEQPSIISRIRLKFNDEDENAIKRLRSAIMELPNSKLLSDRIDYSCCNVACQNPAIIIPATQTLSYLDPFGIEGLTLELLRRGIDGFGKDMIIFFSFDAINRFFVAESFQKHMQRLFGDALTAKMKQELRIIHSNQREDYFIDNFRNVLKGLGAEYVLPYRLVRSDSERTGHYIIFASKHYLGRKIMADIMKSQT